MGYPPPPRGLRLLGPSHAIDWRKYKKLMRKNRIKLTPAERDAFIAALMRNPTHD
jgi:hypothetical protein